MKPNTVAALRVLEKVEWFHAVGKPDFTGVKQLKSWMEAVANGAGSDWEIVQHDAVFLFRDQAVNKLRGWTAEQRRARSLANIEESIRQGGGFVGPPIPEAFPEWDQIREEIRPAIVALVHRKTQPVVAREGLPDLLLARVVFDILYLAMEHEFADVVPGWFFTKNAQYYAKGHFPCGWEGSFPEGRLIVY